MVGPRHTVWIDSFAKLDLEMLEAVHCVIDIEELAMVVHGAGYGLRDDFAMAATVRHGESREK